MTDTPPTPPAKLTRWQLAGLAVPLAAVAAYAVGLAVARPGFLDTLVNDPMGEKLLLSAAGMLAVHVVVYVGGCFLLDRAGREQPNAAGRSRNLSVVLAVVCTFALDVPVLFVLTVGPAAVRIQRDLTPP